MRLSDQIALEKREEMENAVFIAPQDASWIRAKKEVNKLSSDYVAVIGSAKKKIRRAVTNGDVIEVSLPDIEGYEVMLYVAEHTDGRIIKAQYQLFDNVNSTVWIRSLLRDIDHVAN